MNKCRTRYWYSVTQASAKRMVCTVKHVFFIQFSLPLKFLVFCTIFFSCHITAQRALTNILWSLTAFVEYFNEFFRKPGDYKTRLYLTQVHGASNKEKNFTLCTGCFSQFFLIFLVIHGVIAEQNLGDFSVISIQLTRVNDNKWFEFREVFRKFKREYNTT